MSRATQASASRRPRGRSTGWTSSIPRRATGSCRSWRSSASRRVPAARRLSLGRTLTVGVVVSFLTRPQAAERLRGVDAVLDRQRVRPRHLQRRVGPEARPLPGHAGPVAAHRRADRDVAAAARRGRRRCSAASPVPVVFIDVHTPSIAAHAARRRRRRRRRRAGRSAPARARPPRDRLHRRRGRRIRSGSRRAATARQGLTRELARAGVSIPDAWIGHGAHGRYEARDLARRMLAGRRPADGDLHRQRHAGAGRHRRGARDRPARPRRPVGHRLRRHRGRRLRRSDDGPPAAVRVGPPRRRGPAGGDRAPVPSSRRSSRWHPSWWSVRPRRHRRRAVDDDAVHGFGTR